MTAPELKPCPWCRQPPILVGADFKPGWESVECANSECPMQPSTGYGPCDESVADWNTRAPDREGEEAMSDTDVLVAKLMSTAYPIRLTPQQARLFLALWWSKNRVATYTIISHRMHDLSASNPSNDAIRSTLKHLRKSIKLLNWPICITSFRQIGYMLTAPNNWDWEKLTTTPDLNRIPDQ